MPSSSDADTIRLAVERGILSPDQAATVLREAPQTSAPGAVLADLVQRGWLAADQARDLAGAAESAETVRPAAAPADTVVQRAAAPARSPGLGRTFGRYELLDELGRGGMGVVYKAFHPGLRSVFALKVLLAGTDASADDVRRFEREAQASARLRHPGIVAVHDVGVEDGKSYIAMEFIEGANLDRVIADPARFGIVPARGAHSGQPGEKRRTGIDAATAVRMTQEIAEALHAAHSAGVVHRDLKPVNVMRDASGRLKVMDFGLAKIVEGADAGATRTGVLMGTPAYMSPEQAEGRVKEVDARSDVYQVGAILYELLCGRPPFAGGTPLGIAIQVIGQEPPPPHVWNVAIDRDAETICLKAMARVKEDRYGSAQELADDCRRYLAGEALRARPEEWWKRPLRWAKRRPLVVGLAAVALATAAMGGQLAWRAHRAEVQRIATHAENNRLRREVVDALRENARTNLQAVLMVRRAGGRMAEAEAEFLPGLKKAAADVLQRDPTLAEPHYHLGRFYRALMRFPEAAAEQTAALATDPDFPAALYERAVLRALACRDRIEDLRARWRATEGRRLASEILEQDADRGGETLPALPPDPVLETRDPETQALRAGMTEDLTRLEELARRGASVDAAQLDCLRGVILAFTGQSSQDRKRAQALLTTAMSTRPLPEEACEGLGHLASDAGQFPAMVEVYSRGIEADAGYVPFLEQRAHALQNQAMATSDRGGDPLELFTRAEADWTRTIGLSPPKATHRIFRGNIRLAIGWVQSSQAQDPAKIYSQADMDFAEAVKLDPGNASAWAFRGAALVDFAILELKRGENPARLLDRAEEALDRSIQLDSSDEFAWNARGGVHANRAIASGHLGASAEEEFGKAEADYTQALERLGKSRQSWIARGTVRMLHARSLGEHGGDAATQYAAAEADLGKALELSPRLYEALRLRAQVRAAWAWVVLTHDGDPRELYLRAIADLDEIQRQRPSQCSVLLESADVRRILAQECLKRGADPTELLARAEADLCKALAARAKWPEARIVRARIRWTWSHQMAKDGRDPEPLQRGAVEDLGEAIALDPGKPEPYRYRGELRYARKEWAGCAADFEELARLDPASAVPYVARRKQAHLEALLGGTDGRDATWFEIYRLAERATVREDRDAMEKGYIESLAAVAGALDALAKDARDRALADAEYRTMTGHMHLNLACTLSLRSAGLTGPKATPAPIAAEASAQIRDLAFEHLRAAVEMDAKNTELLRKDPWLEPLHADPRWAAIAGE